MYRLALRAYKMSKLPADSNATLTIQQKLHFGNFLVEVHDSKNTLVITETNAQQQYIQSMIDEAKVSFGYKNAAMDEQPVLEKECKSYAGVYLWSPTKGFINENPEVEEWFKKNLMPLLGTATPYLFAIKYKIKAIEETLQTQKQNTTTIHVL